jgi:hypothetical protein
MNKVVVSGNSSSINICQKKKSSSINIITEDFSFHTCDFNRLKVRFASTKPFFKGRNGNSRDEKEKQGGGKRNLPNIVGSPATPPEPLSPHFNLETNFMFLFF